MGWRTSVRKQINRAKSRRVENAITTRIAKENREGYEKNYKQIHNDGRSLSYDYDCTY